MTIFSDAYLPYPYGPVPSPGTPSPKFVDLLNNQTVGGDKTITGLTRFTRDAQASASEEILRASVSDDGTAYLTLLNLYTANNAFAPSINVFGTNARSDGPVFRHYFRVGAAQDTGAVGVFDEYYSNNAGSAVGTRPIKRIFNGATVVSQTGWAGNVASTIIAQPSVAETLATWGVSDTGSAGINFLNGTTGDSALLPRVLLRPTSGFGAVIDGYGAADTPGLVQLQLKGSVLGTPASNSIPIGFYNAGRLDATMEAGGSFALRQPGQGFRIVEGANCKQGVATLTSGTVTVANTSVTANSRIHATGQDNNVTGTVRISTRTPGVSFTLTSTNAADSGVVAYTIFEPS